MTHHYQPRYQFEVGRVTRCFGCARDFGVPRSACLYAAALRVKVSLPDVGDDPVQQPIVVAHRSAKVGNPIELVAEACDRLYPTGCGCLKDAEGLPRIGAAESYSLVVLNVNHIVGMHRGWPLAVGTNQR